MIDRHLNKDAFRVALQKITQKPIEIAYDAVAFPETQQAAWSVIAQGGTLVMTLHPVVKEEEGKGRTVIATYGDPHVETNKTMCCGSWNILGKWLQDGIIKVCNKTD